MEIERVSEFFSFTVIKPRAFHSVLHRNAYASQIRSSNKWHKKSTLDLFQQDIFL